MTNFDAPPPSVRPEPEGPASLLPWLLRRTNQRYRAAIRDRLADHRLAGLPQPGYWALVILAGGGCDARQLMSGMGVSKQAVSKLVDNLVAGGFVDRRPNDADRRRTDLLLSAKGREAADIIADAVRETDEAFAAELGPERFAGLVEMLEQMTGRHD